MKQSKRLRHECFLWGNDESINDGSYRIRKTGSSYFLMKLLLLSCSISTTTAQSTTTTTLLESPKIQQKQKKHLKNIQSFHSTTNKDSSFIIPDTATHCTVEDLERVNTGQFNFILNELRRTSFFKYFVVDLDQTTCPLDRKQNNNENTGTSTQQEPQTEDEDSSSCAGHLPHEWKPFGADEPPQSACHVQDENEGEGLSFIQQTISTPQEHKIGDSDNKFENSMTTSNDAEFECTGGLEFGLDPDAEPLCSVQTETNHFGSDSPTTTHSVAFTETNNSPAKTISMTDLVVTEQEVNNDSAATDSCPSENDQNNDPSLVFWQDICWAITQDKATQQTVNLVLNPKRNTGYNGSHIWEAMYNEICLTPQEYQDDDDDDHHHDKEQCLEERVLYRLLSGLQTSTAISIAKNYYPPLSDNQEWQPNPQLFLEKFQNHQEEWLLNLHFSYLVLLKAVYKAMPHLYHYAALDNNEQHRTLTLLQRLLDSASLFDTCHSVFTAFDEGQLFSNHDYAAALPAANATTTTTTTSSAETTTTETTGTSSLLKENFKRVFHNISYLLDCVQCQQCKLHGKMTMLAYGTALKILFTNPVSTLKFAETNDDDNTNGAVVIKPNEVVALINIMAKFSDSLHDAKELAQLAQKV